MTLSSPCASFEGCTSVESLTPCYIIPYSAKFSCVFNFVNFQLLAKTFQILTSSVQCTRAANLQNYFNKIFKNCYSRKFSPSKILCYRVCLIVFTLGILRGGVGFLSWKLDTFLSFRRGGGSSSEGEAQEGGNSGMNCGVYNPVYIYRPIWCILYILYIMCFVMEICWYSTLYVLLWWQWECFSTMKILTKVRRLQRCCENHHYDKRSTWNNWSWAWMHWNEKYGCKLASIWRNKAS